MRAVRASPPDGVFRHEAEIERLLRPVGSRTYATFRIGGAPVVAELMAHDVSRPGDRIPIDVNLKRAASSTRRPRRRFEQHRSPQ